MELVYLWVDSYKNIEKQGFNFSPKFECSYDGENLTIKEKDHIEYFFGKNINITAIVGKNGSGKSSIFEILEQLYLQNKLTLNKKNYTFLIFYENKEFKILYNNNEYTNDTTSINKNKINKIKLNKMVMKLHELKVLKDAIKLKSFFIHKPIKKQFGGDNLSTLSLEFYKEFSYVLKDNKDFFISLNENFIFNNYQFVLDISKYIETKDLKSIDEKLYRLLKYNDKNIYDKEKSLYQYIVKVIYLFSIQNSIIEKIFTTEIEEEIKKEQFEIKLIEKLLDNKHINHKVFSIDNIKKVINYDMTYASKNDKTTLYLGANEYRSDVYSISEDRINEKLEKNKLLSYLLENELITCDFFHDQNLDHNYSSLSTGEQSYIKFLTNLTYALLNKINDKPLFALCDEIETSLHPQWQKRVINNVLILIKENKIENNIYFIFASHSPFILSDLPKENVMFLKDGKQVDPDINTFGANIHTLLSHGFFMDGGLMGEFAKGKIDEVIKLLNSSNKLTDEKIQHCENIISIIGEPIIKNQLRRMLDSKRLKKVDEIDDIKKNIEEMQKRLEELENDKS